MITEKEFIEKSEVIRTISSGMFCLGYDNINCRYHCFAYCSCGRGFTRRGCITSNFEEVCDYVKLFCSTHLITIRDGRRCFIKK